MIGKKALPLTFAVLIVALLVNSTNAYAQTSTSGLHVEVSSDPEVIVPGQDVLITATANMNGRGIVFVVQPIHGSSTASSASEDVQIDLNTISSDSAVSLWRIISYALVNLPESEGGTQELTFPDDFTGLNGAPSTNTPGKYCVFFVFIHLYVCKIGFDCSSFFVIPEVPFGTLMAAVASFGALSGHVAVKRLRIKR